MSNPILAFSVRRRMRSFRAPLLITLYALALGLVAYFGVYARFLGAGSTIDDMRSSVLGYALMVILQFALLVLVAPGITAASISGERERQTLDLVLVTHTGPLKLLTGKLLESFGFLTLMVLCSMPMLSLVLMTGAASMAQVLQAVAFLALTGLLALSIGLFCSALLKRTAQSTVISYLAVFAAGVLTLLPLWYDVDRLGEIYDACNAAGIAMTTIDYLPISFTINPGLGLFSLIQSQTGLFEGMFWGLSQTLAVTLEYMPLERYLYANMIFMGAASVALALLSALLFKTGRAPKIKRSKRS